MRTGAAGGRIQSESREIFRKGFLKISQFPAELVEEMPDPKVESVAKDANSSSKLKVKAKALARRISFSAL